MKTRRRKFSIGLKIASLLTVIAVVSVGLASWIITAPTEESTITGTIQVDEVSTSKVTLTGEWVNVTEQDGTIEVDESTPGNPVIYYGVPENPSVQNSNPWLTNDDGKTENLVAWLKVTATAENADVPDLTVTFAASDVTQFEDAIDKSMSIGAPEFTVWAQTGESTYAQQGNTLEYATNAAGNLQIALDGSNTHTYYIKVQFKWGLAFDNTNAYDYFNAEAYNEPLATQAKDALEALHAALEGVSYKMTIAAA